MSVCIVGCGLRDVELVEVAGGVLAQRPREVVVAVDERHLLVQRPGAGEQRVLLRRLRHGDGGKREQREGESQASHAGDYRMWPGPAQEIGRAGDDR